MKCKCTFEFYPEPIQSILCVFLNVDDLGVLRLLSLFYREQYAYGIIKQLNQPYQRKQGYKRFQETECNLNLERIHHIPPHSKHG